MSTQNDPAPDPERLRLQRTLEVILRSRLTGLAVAETLTTQAAEREVRTLVADLRARRARDAYDRDADLREGERLRPDTLPSPWARPA